MSCFLINTGDDVGREVNDPFQIFWCQIKQVAQPGRNTLEVPDVSDRSSQLNVAHALTTHLGFGYLNTTAFTDDALIAHPLVLTTGTLPVPRGTENTFTKQTVALWLERTVVNRLRLLNLAFRPTADVVGSGQADAELFEEVDV